MKFIIDTIDKLDINDNELSELLEMVFVDGGYTEASLASSIFNPSSIRNRRLLIGVRDSVSSLLAGIVILVPATSSACKIATDNEAEIHLLSVMPKFRRLGLGKSLVEAAIYEAKRQNITNIILWTQKTMKNAQSLYESLGFLNTRELCKNNIDFKVYELKLYS